MHSRKNTVTVELLSPKNQDMQTPMHFGVVPLPVPVGTQVRVMIQSEFCHSCAKSRFGFHASGSGTLRAGCNWRRANCYASTARKVLTHHSWFEWTENGVALNSELFDGTILSLQVCLNTVVTVRFSLCHLAHSDWNKMWLAENVECVSQAWKVQTIQFTDRVGIGRSSKGVGTEGF